MAIERNPARELAIGQIAAAKPLKLACRADAANRCIKPERQQNPRINGRAARFALHGFDRSVKRRKIECAREGPDRARLPLL